ARQKVRNVFNMGSRDFGAKLFTQELTRQAETFFARNRVSSAFFHQFDALGGSRLAGSCPLHPLDRGPRHQTLPERPESSSLGKRWWEPILAVDGSRNALGPVGPWSGFSTQGAMPSRVRNTKLGVPATARAFLRALFFMRFSS